MTDAIQHPARRRIWWVASLGDSAAAYRVDQRVDGGDWSAIGAVMASAGQWSFLLVTEPLADLAVVAWRIVPLDAAGNEGPPLALGPEKIVRTPDAPNFTISYNPLTQRLTFI